MVVDAAAGRLAACLEGHGSAINDVAVHPTRPQFAVTASRDHSLRLWNLATRYGGGRVGAPGVGVGVGGRVVGGWAACR